MLTMRWLFVTAGIILGRLSKDVELAYEKAIGHPLAERWPGRHSENEGSCPIREQMSVALLQLFNITATSEMLYKNENDFSM